MIPIASGVRVWIAAGHTDMRKGMQGLTSAEIATLDAIDAARAKPRILRKTLATYLLQIAMLGGYLARNRDPPPGNMVVWRGLTRLNDMAFGISVCTHRRCG